MNRNLKPSDPPQGRRAGDPGRTSICKDLSVTSDSDILSARRKLTGQNEMSTRRGRAQARAENRLQKKKSAHRSEKNPGSSGWWRTPEKEAAMFVNVERTHPSIFIRQADTSLLRSMPSIRTRRQSRSRSQTDPSPFTAEVLHTRTHKHATELNAHCRSTPSQI